MGGRRGAAAEQSEIDESHIQWPSFLTFVSLFFSISDPGYCFPFATMISNLRMTTTGRTKDRVEVGGWWWSFHPLFHLSNRNGESTWEDTLSESVARGHEMCLGGDSRVEVWASKLILTFTLVHLHPPSCECQVSGHDDWFCPRLFATLSS